MADDYPPPHHVLRDLRLATERTDDGWAITTAPVVDEICRHGAVRAGALAALIDVAGAAVALDAVLPDWIATADLSYHACGRITEGPVVIHSLPLRVGAGLVVTEARLFDGHDAAAAADRPAGLATMTFARIPGRATNVARDEEGRPVRRTEPWSGGGFGTPILDACGIVEVTPGVLEVGLVPYVENSFGTLNGGVVALVLEAAAESAAVGRLGRGDLATTDVEVHYLAQTRIGPARTEVTVLRVTDSAMACRVALVEVPTEEVLAVAYAEVEAEPAT